MKNSLWLWIPRGIMFFYIIFLLLFALDAFSTPQPLWDQFLDFIIHGLPSWILIIVLAITWKKPFLAGISVIILSSLGMIFFSTYQHLSGFFVVTLPPMLIGLSFIIYDKMIKDN
jgi:hypothetical protein